MQLGLDETETLRKIDALGLSFHGRTMDMQHRTPDRCGTGLRAFVKSPLCNTTHLESLDLQLVLSREVSLDLIVEAGGDDSGAREKLTSLDPFQATTFEQTCHLVPLLLIPVRR